MNRLRPAAERILRERLAELREIPIKKSNQWMINSLIYLHEALLGELKQ